MHKVNTQVLQAVIAYLQKRPHAEVDQLIRALSLAEEIKEEGKKDKK